MEDRSDIQFGLNQDGQGKLDFYSAQLGFCCGRWKMTRILAKDLSVILLSTRYSHAHAAKLFFKKLKLRAPFCTGS